MMARGRVVLAACLVLVLTAACGAGGENVPTPDAVTAENYDEYDSLYVDWNSRYVQCVNDAGGNARVNSAGSIENAYEPGRALTEGLDALCVDAVGRPPEPPPLTEA